MPLNAAYPTLITDIEAAFEDKKSAMEALEKNDDAARAAIDKKFYLALATAIHSYTMQAQVIAYGGGPVTGVAGPLAPVGACPIVGASVVTTSGNLV